MKILECQNKILSCKELNVNKIFYASINMFALSIKRTLLKERKQYYRLILSQ